MQFAKEEVAYTKSTKYCGITWKKVTAADIRTL